MLNYSTSKFLNHSKLTITALFLAPDHQLTGHLGFPGSQMQQI